ncbi:MAG: hypothetical protein AAF525_21290, partial [Pseudomonadota bacterium]
DSRAMMESRLFGFFVNHWHHVAFAVIAIAGLSEIIVDGLDANSSIEWYLMLWAATTGGLWFIFDTCEKSLSVEARDAVRNWVTQRRESLDFSVLPAQFSRAFDLIFTERHTSITCILRSIAASLIATALFYVLAVSFGFLQFVPETLNPEDLWIISGVLLGSLVLNAIPDYLSLLETRWMMRWVESKASVVWVLLGDLVLTSLIFFLWIGIWVVLLTVNRSEPLHGYELLEFLRFTLSLSPLDASGDETNFSFGVFFYSTFFTSIWLWLYVAGGIVSRILVHANNGTGILLRIADFDKQPLRALGFTCVITITLIFVVGLPVAVADHVALQGVLWMVVLCVTLFALVVGIRSRNGKALMIVAALLAILNVTSFRSVTQSQTVPARLVEPLEIAGIKPGMSARRVREVLGEPARDDWIPMQAGQVERRWWFPRQGRWISWSEQTRISLTGPDLSELSVNWVCRRAWTPLAGIHRNDSEEDVKGRLGGPSSISSNMGDHRVLYYSELQLAIHLRANSVQEFCLSAIPLHLGEETQHQIMEDIKVEG